MVRAFRTQNMMFESTSASNIDTDRFLLARLAIREETTFIIFVGVIVILLEPA
jgi:ribosomal protein L20